MKIKELYETGKPVVSFEVFPPKKDADIDDIYHALEEMSGLKPDFVSVTYGAGGGGNVNYTAEIAATLQERYCIPSMAHLTCIMADRERIQSELDSMRARGIENVLALRGDIPQGRTAPEKRDYPYARDMIREIRERGDFCVGAACYAEGHIDSEDPEQDLQYLREKQEAGADFLVSQLFFDNELFFRFQEKAAGAGITLPISAGVMPILGRKQIERMIFMCGASLPATIVRLLHRYEDQPEDLRKAGIEYAAQQLRALLEHGVDGVHVYTMNRPDIARHCMSRIGRIG